MSYQQTLLLTISAEGPGAAAFLGAVRRHADILGIRPLSEAFHVALADVGTPLCPQLLAMPQLLTMEGRGHA